MVYVIKVSFISIVRYIKFLLLTEMFYIIIENRESNF